MTNKFRFAYQDTPDVEPEIKIFVGDTPTVQFIVPLSDLAGGSHDFDNGSVTFGLKDDKLDPVVTISKTEADDVTVVGPSEGVIDVIFTNSDTTSLGEAGGLLYFDIKFEDAGSQVYTVMAGRIRLVPDVSE